MLPALMVTIVRKLYICMAKTREGPCGTCATEDGWLENKPHRYYCPCCGARYRLGFGHVLEFQTVDGNCGYVRLADKYIWELDMFWFNWMAPVVPSRKILHEVPPEELYPGYDVSRAGKVYRISPADLDYLPVWDPRLLVG